MPQTLQKPAPDLSSFVPQDVLGVLEKIHRRGIDVYIVGGALRDYYLGQEPQDWDLAAGAAPENILSLFPRVVPIGIRHGTVQVLTGLRGVEVTSFDPAGGSGIFKDLARRDFTINSMALSYPGGVLLDPSGGREDIGKGLIRAVGDPRARFEEDPLRTIRAARLSALLGFEVSRETFNAMREESESIDRVSPERIRDEICKILMAPHPVEAFDLLRRGWVLGKILPELVVRNHYNSLPDTGQSLYRHALMCVVNSPPTLRVRLAALLLNAGVPVGAVRGENPPEFYREESARAAASVLKKWNMSNRQIEEVTLLVQNRLTREAEAWDEARIRRFITRVGPELLDDLAALARAECLAPGAGEAAWVDDVHARMRRQLGIFRVMRPKDLAVSGREIMERYGLPQGPEVGRVLKMLFEAVLDNPELNERDRLLEIADKEVAGRRKWRVE